MSAVWAGLGRVAVAMGHASNDSALQIVTQRISKNPQCGSKIPQN
jgi:hypothetical protein